MDGTAAASGPSFEINAETFSSQARSRKSRRAPPAGGGDDRLLIKTTGAGVWRGSRVRPCEDALRDPKKTKDEAAAWRAMGRARHNEGLPDLDVVAQELGAAIQHQVIPRLLSAHGCVSEAQASGGQAVGHRVVQDDAQLVGLDGEGLAHLAVTGGDRAVITACEQLLRAGIDRDAVFLDRLAPAARALGEFWRTDVYSFVDVTLGMCRLRQAFETLRAQDVSPEAGGEAFRALIAPAPGETHAFGAAMIARLFSQAGWAVTEETPGDEVVLLDHLRSRRFELLGLSVNADHALEGLAGFVLKAKRESKNRDLVILLGGSLIAARPEIAREVGGVAAPCEPRRAIAEAELMVRRAVRRM
jgi:methanogenic corrinoid protein MtbC1